MVLSPRSLPYARLALESLLRRCAEPLHLQLITDSLADQQQLQESFAPLTLSPGHSWTVVAEDELADAESTHFSRFTNLRAFRHGHPCLAQDHRPPAARQAGR